jgi:mannose-6-phosphate isomerase-like protein (cupin superfamily)
MSLPARRVVTGHTPDGRAKVSIDDTLRGVSGRPNVTVANIWTTEGFPVVNTGDQDQGQREVGTTLANGTVFRIVEFGPGNSQRVHRTDSVDYAVVMSGEIDMELEPGSEPVHLKAGDVLVQRGTIHNWINRGPQPCAIAFILIDAKPVEVGGRVLRAQG